LTVNSWSDGNITATLSGGYTSGPLVASRGLANSNPFPFTYTGPVITVLIPDAGGTGTTVSIQGQNLSSVQGQAQVTFGGVQASIIGNIGNTIQAVVPAGIGFGPTSVVVQLGAHPTNALQFDVVPAPVLTAITPNTGITGQTVKISGANFGLFQANSTVYFGQVATQPVTWTESIISVPVPANFFGGMVTVVVAGQRSNGLPFKVPLRCRFNCNAQPTSISLSPQNLSVVVGDQVELGVINNLGEGVAYPQFSLSDSTLGMLAVSNDVATFTALAPGTATVTAIAGSFTASTTITIYDGAELPDGTVQWHVPMPGLDGPSQLPEFIPAQPAVDAQTATFVMDDSNTNNVIIHALNSNGRQLWSWITGSNDDKFFFGTSLLPTPSGGVAYATDNAITSLDANGNPLWSYPGVEVSGAPMAVGYDGTVYTVVDTNPAIASISPGFIADFPEESSPTGQYQTYLVALDGQTGQEKFKIPLPRSRSTNNAFFNGFGGDITSTSQTDQDQTPPLSGPMVLADGSVNLVVFTQTGSTTAVPNGTQSIPSCISDRTCDQPPLEYWQATTDQAQSSVHIETDLLHVNPDGSSQLYTLNQSGSSWDQIGWHFVAHACSGYTPGFCDTLINSIYYRFEALAWYAGNGPSNLVGPNGLDLQLVPNGSGGLLVSSDATDPTGQATTVWLKNIQQPSSSGDGPEFSLPIEVIHNLVIGENGTAFAAGYSTDFLTSRLLSFNLNSGAPNWTYDSTFGGYNGWVDLVAAGPDGSLRATEGFYKEARVAFTLDANGIRTDDPVSGDQITFLTSAGIGSRTWLGADQTTLASLGGFDTMLGMPAFMQSAVSVPASGLTAFVGAPIFGNRSPCPMHCAGRAEQLAIPVLVYEVEGTTVNGSPVDPSTISERVRNSIHYWEEKTGTHFTFDGTVTPVPGCAPDPQTYPNGCSDPLLDISDINNPKTGAEIVRRFCDKAALPRCQPLGIQLVFVSQVANSASAGYTPFTGSTSSPRFMNISAIAAGVVEDDSTVFLTGHDISHELGHEFQLQHFPSNAVLDILTMIGFLPFEDTYSRNLMCGSLLFCPTHAAPELLPFQVDRVQRTTPDLMPRKR
jgi:hypothetical protein